MNLVPAWLRRIFRRRHAPQNEPGGRAGRRRDPHDPVISPQQRWLWGLDDTEPK